MFQKVLNFIKYNNAAAIIFTMIFGGISATFAASPTARDSIYSSTQTVQSIDNHAIVNADMDNFDFGLQITGVTSDDTNYYVAYTYNTLAINNYVWGNSTVSKTLTVNKDSLNGEDLGLYAARQLSDNIKYERETLTRVQALEKSKGETNEVIDTQYAGLIGKFIDPTQDVVEGYNPVVPQAATAEDAPTPLGSGSDTPTITDNSGDTTSTPADSTNTNTDSSSTDSSLPPPTFTPEQMQANIQSAIDQYQAAQEAQEEVPATPPTDTTTPPDNSQTPPADTTTPDNTTPPVQTTPPPDSTSAPDTTAAPATPDPTTSDNSSSSTDSSSTPPPDNSATPPASSN